MNSGTGSGSKGKLIIIIVVVLLILYILSRMMGFFGNRAVEQVINQQTGGNSEVSGNGQSGTITTDKGTVTWGTNTLPSGWPSEISVYPGATIQYSGAGKGGSGQNASTIVLASSDSPDTISAYYKNVFSTNGWTITGTANTGGGIIIGAKNGAKTGGVSITPGQSGSTVAVSVSQ
ncbi:MAG: hypothetical protein PHV42_00575 [Candidatus Pacebacteria bacterium]|nr:hypothetical protein [Candidatus Paceibacterota bacterium]